MLLLLCLVPLALLITESNDDTSEDGAGRRIEGTDGMDDLTGTNGDDRIEAQGGDDLANGSGGADLIFMGDGNDRATGGDGNDTLWGGEGNDRVTGGPGDDVVNLEGGDDIYDPRADLATDPDAGNDTIRGGDGNDAILDFLGQNQISGGSGNDLLVAEDIDASVFAPDEIAGGNGNDSLFGDDGDTMNGGIGADQFGVWTNQPDDAAVLIEDFDPAADILYLYYDTGELGTVTEADLRHEADPEADTLSLFVKDQLVAVLANTQTFDPGLMVLRPQ
ncbi:calcium-binding protein [Paracoccaceae bacterium Fryx2]|nr:calcium-binding protein [Paracoccaceae bacterium Fryx2]